MGRLPNHFEKPDAESAFLRSKMRLVLKRIRSLSSLEVFHVRSLLLFGRPFE